MKFDERRHVGLFAQDVQAVLPEAVSPILNGDYLGVNYSDLVPVIVEALKELETKISNLETLRASMQAESAEDESASCANLLDVVLALKERVLALEADNTQLTHQLEALQK